MSKPLRTLIVDDEVLARRYVRRMLKDDVDIEIVGECINGHEAIAVIQRERPDLVFLDVRMPEVDGFAVVEALKGDYLPQIVFTTAYEQYAIRAFEMHALDYLLKPFDQVRFADMLRHVKKQIGQGDIGIHPRVEALIKGFRQSQYLERLVVKSAGRITFIKVSDINWIEADDKYVQLHLEKTTRMVRQTLNSMERQLDPKHFSRIHRSIIVNIDRIQELQPLFNGEYVVLLEDGMKLSLSRGYKDKLFNVLGRPL